MANFGRNRPRGDLSNRRPAIPRWMENNSEHNPKLSKPARPGKLDRGRGFKTIKTIAPQPNTITANDQAQEFTRLVAKWMAAALLEETGEHEAAERVWE